MVWAPHTFGVHQPASATQAATRHVLGVGYADPVLVRGQATPMDAKALFDSEGIELDRPYLVILPPQDEGLLNVGALVDWGGVLLTVERPERPFRAFGVAAHTSAVCRRLQYPGDEHEHREAALSPLDFEEGSGGSGVPPYGGAVVGGGGLPE